MCSAGTDSKQFEEWMTCKTAGNDSPKLQTASERSGGMYVERSLMVSSAPPNAVKRQIACSRIAGSMSRERSSVHRAISAIAEFVAAVQVDNSSRIFSHSPATSGGTTECS